MGIRNTKVTTVYAHVATVANKKAKMLNRAKWNNRFLMLHGLNSFIGSR